MTTLTLSTTSNTLRNLPTPTVHCSITSTSEVLETFADGYFNACLGLSPVFNYLGSPYFTGYLTAVVESGNTPF